MKTRLALVLGSGGAKGLAHIGVLKALEELRIGPDLVVGSSMGALIGAFYAAGVSPEEQERVALTMTRRRIARFFTLKPTLSGLIDGKRITKFLDLYFGKRRIEDLRFSYAAVAVDLLTGDEVVFDSGSIAAAIRASGAIPGVLTPLESSGRALVDGGILDPVPIRAARWLGAERVIAVSLSPYRDYKLVRFSSIDLPEKKPDRSEGLKPLLRGIRMSLSKRKAVNLLNIGLRSFEVIQGARLLLQMEELGAGVLIEPDVRNINTFEFHRAREAIDAGYRATMAKRGELLDLSAKALKKS